MNILNRWFYRIGFNKRMRNTEYRNEIIGMFNKKWDAVGGLDE